MSFVLVRGARESHAREAEPDDAHPRNPRVRAPPRVRRPKYARTVARARMRVQTLTPDGEGESYTDPARRVSRSPDRYQSIALSDKTESRQTQTHG